MRRVYLHDEIWDILMLHGNAWMSIDEIARLVNQRGRYEKLDGSEMTPNQIDTRTRKYDHMFKRRGTEVRCRK